jgi:hypothetical protein
MSDSLEFSIFAKDQASKAVETVQKKVKSFGSDIAKSFLSVAAPLALLQTGISAIGTAIEEYKARVKEAVDNAAGLKDAAADIGVSVDEFQRLKGAADESGVGISKVSKLYVEMTKVLEAARSAGSPQRAVLEALGFASEDLAKGSVKAIDAIEAMAKALKGANGETDSLQMASALLGDTLAKELLPALKEGIELKKGFVNTEGLTEEEAAVLRAAKAEERKAAARKEYNDAREAATKRFLETDAEAGKIGVQFGQIRAGFENDPGTRETMKSKAGFMSSDVAVQEAVGKLLAERAAKKKAEERAANEARAAAVRAADASSKAAADEAKRVEKEREQIAKDDAKQVEDGLKDSEKAKDDAAKEAAKADEKRRKELGDAIEAEATAMAKKPEKLTVSSLREIGGALMGESLTSLGSNIPQETLDINKRMLIELEKLNTKTLPEVPQVDFTKPSVLAGNSFMA